jgi:hypothetical protein
MEVCKRLVLDVAPVMTQISCRCLESLQTYPLQAHGLPGDGHPLIAGGDLENCQPGLGEGVKVAAWVAVVEIIVVPPKQLHPEYGKHGNDQEEEGK